jgi:hypothetical protein
MRCEIEYGSVDDWIETCKGFGGNWMWRLLVFPEKMAAACGHEIDHCSSCLAGHMKALVGGMGRDVADNMTCPSEGCNRKLTYEEVVLYADQDTTNLYEFIPLFVFLFFFSLLLFFLLLL